MKRTLSFCALILSFTSAFAQDGYFVRAGYGVGTSSSSFNALPGHPASNHTNVFSEQTQLNFGYTHGNLQLETGIGYLLTGLNYTIGAGGGGCVVGPNPNGTPAPASNQGTYTIKNPHLTVPLVASYTLNNKKKLSVSPGVGVEALYNFKGKMTTTNESDASSEKMDYSYNSVSAAVLLKFDIQYKMCEHLSLWCSPTYQNMISSLTTKVQGDAMSRIYDRAFLINAGVKYNLHCSPKKHTELHGIKD